MAIFTTLTFCSYGQQTWGTVENKNDLASQTDSAKLEHYFQWQNSQKSIKQFKYDDQLLLKIEKKRDSLKILQFLTKNYKIIKPIADFPYKPADLVKYTYAIDLNGDNLLDMVYVGPYSGDYKISQIFLNNDGQYKKVFSGKQEIVKIGFSKKRLNSFTLLNPGCCADPGQVEYNYKVSFSTNKPIFKRTHTIGYYNETEKPLSIFTKTKAFIVKADKAKLRFECYPLDIEHPFYGMYGNSIASYKSGSKGKAIGFKKENDVDWIYVIMSSKNKIDNCDFSTFKDQPTQIRGWILKTDIEWK
ncbi:MAG: hypothetical protein EAZ12_06220 [Sphingobacteriia bacterium]|nr:MAG: hypothetical protein EAZ12_06220 [Sphingobacteriia bacterium]